MVASTGSLIELLETRRVHTGDYGALCANAMLDACIAIVRQHEAVPKGNCIMCGKPRSECWDKSSEVSVANGCIHCGHRFDGHFKSCRYFEPVTGEPKRCKHDVWPYDHCYDCEKEAKVAEQPVDLSVNDLIEDIAHDADFYAACGSDPHWAAKRAVNMLLPYLFISRERDSQLMDASILVLSPDGALHWKDSDGSRRSFTSDDVDCVNTLLRSIYRGRVPEREFGTAEEQTE